MSKRQLATVLEQAGKDPGKWHRRTRTNLVREVTKIAEQEEGAKARYAKTVDNMTSAQLLDSLVESTNAGQNRKVVMLRDEIVARMAM